MTRTLVAGVIFAALTVAEGARILCIMSMPSPSHHVFNRVLTTELAKRGHQVTVFTTDPEEKPVPNHREIIVDGIYDGLHEDFDYESYARISRWQEIAPSLEWGIHSCDKALQSRGARTLLQLASNETFDLVIAEMSLTECLFGFIPKFGNPPVIGITAYHTTPWIRYLWGNFLNPSYVNTYILPFTDHMTFLQRLENFLMDNYVWWYWRYSYMSRMNELAQKFFGDSIPSVLDIERNISLVMLNVHFSTHFSQPEVPGIIPIGGMQISPPKPLPKDIQKYLDESRNGVVYFSLGSNIRSDDLGPRVIRAFVEAFSELPQNVLWKFESESLEGKPENVMIRKWFPQNDILAHPNVKAFISHGGMLSVSEAVYHGVPIIGIPFMVDQYPNLERSIAKGVAVKLEFQDISKETVLEALNIVLNDTSFRERALELSSVFRDRPQTPLETAVFWTEYALRHRGARFLRCASLDLAWYQRLLIDVIAAIVLGIAAVPLYGSPLPRHTVLWNEEEQSRVVSASLDLAWYQRLLIDVIAAIVLGITAVATALYIAARYIITVLCGVKKSKVE